jgi:hypothetical protein
MPEICRFYGIVIRMFFVDHPPPHFHAMYGEYEALISIEDSRIIAGVLPGRALSMVKEWVDLHRGELHDCWALASNAEPLMKIDPLP